jgi:hypothetical protein
MAQQTCRPLIVALATLVFPGWLLFPGWTVAQDEFELVVPSTSIVSTAVRTAGTLRITDSTGAVTVYRREPGYDTAAGDYLAYYSQGARQAILWPRDNRGALQIGEPTSGGRLALRESRMRIRPTSIPANLATPGGVIDSSTYYRLSPGAGQVAGVCLTVDREGRAVMGPVAAGAAAGHQWRLIEAGRGYYRLQCPGSGLAGSLGVYDDSYSAHLRRSTNDIRQLWRISPVGHQPGCYRLINACDDFRGRCLTGPRRGAVTLAPIRLGAEQFWTLERLTPIPPTVLAAHRIASRQLTPNPPLPPARVEMANTHSRELWVLVTDLTDPARSLRLKIPPGQSQSVSLARDAGATLVEVCELATPYGTVQRNEFVTPLPPAVLYDVSVYEVILQSISIDRTVPGGRVDRTNYSPKSVGFFVVPPGAALRDGPMDVYRDALQYENPGGVRRIDPRQWRDEPEAEHPVDALLREFQTEEIPPPQPRPRPESLPPPPADGR